jgi:hypothetical protein
MSRRPTTPDRVAATRCGRHGSAMTAVARAQRSSTLHSYSAPFSVVSLPTEPVGCEELTKGGGLLPVRGSGLGRAAAR